MSHKNRQTVGKAKTPCGNLKEDLNIPLYFELLDLLPQYHYLGQSSYKMSLKSCTTHITLISNIILSLYLHNFFTLFPNIFGKTSPFQNDVNYQTDGQLLPLTANVNSSIISLNHFITIFISSNLKQFIIIRLSH